MASLDLCPGRTHSSHLVPQATFQVPPPSFRNPDRLSCRLKRFTCTFFRTPGPEWGGDSRGRLGVELSAYLSGENKVTFFCVPTRLAAAHGLACKPFARQILVPMSLCLSGSLFML